MSRYTDYVLVLLSYMANTAAAVPGADPETVIVCALLDGGADLFTWANMRSRVHCEAVDQLLYEVLRGHPSPAVQAALAEAAMRRARAVPDQVRSYLAQGDVPLAVGLVSEGICALHDHAAAERLACGLTRLLERELRPLLAGAAEANEEEECTTGAKLWRLKGAAQACDNALEDLTNMLRPRRLAVAMALHPRLGKASPLGALEPSLMHALARGLSLAEAQA